MPSGSLNSDTLLRSRTEPGTSSVEVLSMPMCHFEPWLTDVGLEDTSLLERGVVVLFF